MKTRDPLNPTTVTTDYSINTSSSSILLSIEGQ
jgi:hypothetical protein